MDVDGNAVNKSRKQLVFLMILFLLPPVGAWVAWQYSKANGVSATNNAGTLVHPARPVDLTLLKAASPGSLDLNELKGRWVYLVYADNQCDKACEEQLYLTRQLRFAVNKDTPRVKRVLVMKNTPSAVEVERLQADHKDLQFALAGEAQATFSGKFQGEGFSPAGQQYFLLDPLGNLMMFYNQNISFKGVLKDLQKLLKVSQIG